MIGLRYRDRLFNYVAVARKLLIALWRYLETGMVPRATNSPPTLKIALTTCKSEHCSDLAFKPSAVNRRIKALPYCHTYGMGCHMKTTLNIDDIVMAELKREAARQGRTMSEMVETALRLLLRSQRKRGTLPALPSFNSGGALVDVADRDALYQAMEGR
jgi:Arc/MetJ family transcription regulator